MIKRFFIIFSIMCLAQICFADDVDVNKTPFIKYSAQKYFLLYSAKVKETNGYSNEYFKKKEGYNNWTELIAVHHFPTDYSPVIKAKEFQEYLFSNGFLSGVAIDEENNSAMIDFVVIDSARLPVIIEFNIFKYKKDEVCGSVAMQYAKRYVVNSSLETEKIKKIFERERTKNLNKFSKLDFPALIEREMENGIFISETKKDGISAETSENTPNKTENKVNENLKKD